MDIEKISQYLFSNTTRTYMVLDGASVSNLPMKLYEMRPPRHCLLSGELEPDMAEVAPYLVRLFPKTPFTEWALSEFWGKNWGIFAQSRFPINEMRKHFRSLTTVYDEKADSMLFRFYDPRVLRRFLPTCETDELKIFFGNVDAYFAESEDSENFIRYQIENDIIKETALPVK
jgi:Domain of unknown function (DUF4123)